MEKNYFIQINEKERIIMLQPCTALDAIKLFNFYQNGINILKDTQGVTSIELYEIGESLLKRILL